LKINGGNREDAVVDGVKNPPAGDWPGEKKKGPKQITASALVAPSAWISRVVRGEQGPSLMSPISGQAKRGAGGRSSVVSSSRETQICCLHAAVEGKPIAFDADKAECSTASPFIS
jgi:hypothetical protein